MINANACNMLSVQEKARLSILGKEIAQGSQAAFARLFSLCNKRLFTFSYSIVKSREMAEEVVEDVFVKLWNNREGLSTVDNISTYLYVAVKNHSLNKLSERARQLLTAPFDDIEPSLEAIHQDPYSICITSEMLQKVNQVINTLPPRCKMIFKLIREDGLRYKEVAEILNISVNTIDAQMAIAVKKICTAMGIPASHTHYRKDRSPSSKKI